MPTERNMSKTHSYSRRDSELLSKETRFICEDHFDVSRVFNTSDPLATLLASSTNKYFLSYDYLYKISLTINNKWKFHIFGIWLAFGANIS